MTTAEKLRRHLYLQMELYKEKLFSYTLSSFTGSLTRLFKGCERVAYYCQTEESNVEDASFRLPRAVKLEAGNNNFLSVLMQCY